MFTTNRNTCNPSCIPTMGASALLWMASLLTVHSASTCYADDFRPGLQTFFAAHCNDCHSGGAKEGGLSLSDLSADLNSPEVFAAWERIFDRVVAQEMPPKEADPVPSEQRTKFAALLARPLTSVHAAKRGTVLRRLNRREYQNTLNDLFGVNLDLESRLPEDGKSHEFDNVGQSLSVSMIQLQRYMEAIDDVMDAAVATTTTKPAAKKIVANYADTREGKTHIGKSWKQLADGAVVFFRSGGYPSGMLRDANTRQAGIYRIRITAYGYQTEQPITFAIGATSFARGSERPTFAYRSVPPRKATTVEVEAWIDNNYMVEITPWGIYDADNEIRKSGVNSYSGPGLAILEVELEGPLVDKFPSRGHRLIYDGLERIEVEPSNPSVKSKSWYKPVFRVDTKDANADAAKVLLRIAKQAFRRPVSANDIERYLEIFQAQHSGGATFDDALRTAVVAIFCSPDFLYFREPTGWLDDDALATRLAYFLTRTSPDQELTDAAQRGDLSTKPDALLNHVRRLLQDPRHERFIIDFTDAWLNLRDIEFTSPDQSLFPEFDPFLQHSMLRETRQYVAELIRKDLPVGYLVKSDFAMLNNRLAQHYGIEGVTGPKLRPVPLPPNSARGGLLSQGSILKVSANGTNTSPVVRGVWVTERILGIRPPPPPAGIAGVEPDIRGALTLRELLAKHRNLDTCRNCHELIDPPGFALESFNPIGGWREKFRSLGDGESVSIKVNGRRVRYKLGLDVDAAGKMRDGDAFDGYLMFRDQLASQPDLLAKTLITKLLTFATGREMGFSDRDAIQSLVERSRTQGHSIRAIIEIVVTSEIFRRK